MKTLNLTLNKKWFDMIASGEKKEEYREIKPYWLKRMTLTVSLKKEEMIKECENLKKGADYDSNIVFVTSSGFKFREDYCFPKEFYIISANNGYSKNCPNIKWKHEGITIGEGKPEWGAEPGKIYFILKIGELM